MIGGSPLPDIPTTLDFPADSRPADQAATAPQVPRFLRMQHIARGHLLTLEAGLRRFDRELAQLQGAGADGQQLADWFARFYVFVVQGNLCIATALASAMGGTVGVSLMLILLALITLVATLFVREGDAVSINGEAMSPATLERARELMQ